MTHFMKKLTAVGLAAVCLSGSILSLSVSAAQDYLLGDVNMDSRLDTKDATMILQEYVNASLLHDGKSKLNAFQLLLADINCDGTTSATDAIHALKYYSLSMLGQAPSNWKKISETAKSLSAKVDNRTLSIGISVGELESALGQTAADSITEKRKNYTLTYHIFSPANKKMLIAIADGNTIVGYFGFGTNFSVDTDVNLVRYTDTLGTKAVYGGLALKSGYSLNYTQRSDLNDLQDYSKLCWYVTNGVRAINGLSALKWSDTAAKCAREHSTEMAAYNLFDHNSRDGSSFSARLTRAGINYRACAENIDGGYSTFIDSVDGWYNSQGHRKNMLTEYKNVGIGFAYRQGSQFGIYGTQDFYTSMNE